MTEKRRQALVAYLAALFGVAFVVVLVSLVIQINKGNTIYTSSTDKVLSLQTQVQELKAENEELTSTVSELQDTLLEVQEGTEYLEAVAYDATAEIQQMEQTQQAYRYLIAAQNAYIDSDRDTMNTAINELTTLYQLLDDDSQQAYFMILEHMEEYYLGVE